ncbi:S-adenosyl-L-methionine-dependent methyltransferase [Mycena leptocephala]|nr:S-adenosyl-L-methionine-dependent methyltransferase [Mycena leptocephala]
MLHVQQIPGVPDNSPETNEVSIKHAPRDYQAYPGSKYALPHDEMERQRHHHTLKSLFENRILLAPVSLDENDKVLEIGTGPGLWVMDLATTIAPSVPMVAVDIEPRLFPASPPKNIEFRVESVTNLPSEWTDTFSLVHQRLLMAGPQVPQWPKALQEIYRVLRPGGWVQIAESSPFHEDKYPGKPCMEKLTTMFRRVTDSRNLYVDCAYDMPKMLEEAGFVDIRSESRMLLLGKWAGEIGVANATNHVGVLRGFKTPVLEAGGFGYVTSEAEYDELLNGLEKEWDEIPGSEMQFFVFWARKPLV